MKHIARFRAYLHAPRPGFAAGARHRVFVWAIGVMFVLQAGILWAANFQVNPIQVFLTAKTSSALLALRNTSSESLRLQVSAFAWDQSPEGEVLLGATEDIVVFPALVTVAPGADRKIRIGRLTGISAIEKSYRVFIEELPPQSKGKTDGKPQIQILTKMGVPVFLPPQKQNVEARLEEMVVRKGILAFKLTNAGNSHFIPQGFSIKGLGEKSETLFVTEPHAWYILAGGYRAYQLELPKQDCGRARSVTIEAKAGETVLKESLQMAPGFCAE